MKFSQAHINLGMELILRDPTKKSVTVFFGNLANVKERVRFTRSKNPFKSKRKNGRTYEEISITLGEPNYSEREFLHQCYKAKCLPRRWRATFFKEKKNASR